MNNSISSNKEQQLNTWAQIINDCNEAKASGIKIKDWLRAHNISKDTYYYWYREVKNFFSSDSFKEIVPVPSELVPSGFRPSPVVQASSIPSPSTVSCIKLTINDISIEVNELTDPELLTNVIKAVRYA